MMITGTAIRGSAAEFKDSNTSTFNYNLYKWWKYQPWKIQFIADHIAGESLANMHENNVSPCGLACLFGHKIETTTATETEHNAHSSTKYLVKKYKIKYCTRSFCDYI